jgi:hypothetical protein
MRPARAFPRKAIKGNYSAKCAVPVRRNGGLIFLEEIMNRNYDTESPALERLPKCLMFRGVERQPAVTILEAGQTGAAKWLPSRPHAESDSKSAIRVDQSPPASSIAACPQYSPCPERWGINE